MIVIFQTIFSVFSFLYLTATAFLYSGLKRLSKSSGKRNTRNYSFSIVIAARNEEANILACLESVCSQTIDKSRYEVVLVEDRSTDRTFKLAQDFAAGHSNVKIVPVYKTIPGISPKKYAVSLGIKAAENEIIVFTDADCRVRTTWLETINSGFDENTGLVQGITTYSRAEGINDFLFNFQAVDFLSHGIIAAAAIGAKFPLNSNANNMSFRKSAFDAVGGYGFAGSVVSGDDDLLLQRIWKSKKWNIKYMTDASGAVYTFPAKSFNDMFEQRKRWGSKTVHYTRPQMFFLGEIFFFYLCIPASIIAALFFPILWISTICLLIVKLIGEYMLLLPGMKMFDKNELRKYIIPGSILQLPMVLCAVVIGVFFKFVWKGGTYKRKIKCREGC